MKNLLASWFRSLTAIENIPVKQEFSIADPTSADPKGLNTVTLAVSPSNGQSPTMVSLYFEASGVKLFEKKYHDDQDAQTELSAMAQDLNEAATLSKEGKIDEAKNLVSSLIEKYKRSSDTLVQPSPVTTNTQASQNAPLVYKGFSIKQLEDGSWQASQDELAFRADSVDSVKAKVDNMLRKAYGKKLAKRAEIVMQNLFFSTPDEAMEYQEKMKALQGPEGSSENKPLWEQMNGEEQVAPSNETPEGEDEELAPPSLSFDRIEKDKAKSDKDIGKRIKEQVKTEVESALEQKSASVFGPDQEELVEALRKNGRNWDEIKKIFVKELSYNEDDTTVFLDSIRQKEEGGPAEGLPMPPKPPEDLVSPETHDKLVKEVTDKSEPKPEPLPLADEIARADNAEIRKVADWSEPITKGAVEYWLANNPNPEHKDVQDYLMVSINDVVPGRDINEGMDVMWYDPHGGHGEGLSGDKLGWKKISPEEAKQLSQYALLPPYYKLASLNIKAINPLQEPPAVGQNPGQPMAAPVEEAPTFDSPVPPSQDSNPEPEFLEAPQAGDRVYVMGDYETGQDGFEGTMVSEYTSKGDEYAVISKDDGENAEVALHRVVKAFQKKVAKAYYEKVASEIYCKNPDCKRKATVRLPEGNYCEKHAPAKKEAYLEGYDYFCPKCKDQLETNMEVRQHDKSCDGKVELRSPEEQNAPEHKEADLEKDSAQNADVIRMFIDNSFPNDKMPSWGTPNLKITKYPNGWALVNYQTPILYRANGSDVIVFNTQKYSVTTSKIQNQIRSMFAGQSVKETDEQGILQEIPISIPKVQVTQSEPEVHPELQSLHESALKLRAELEREGEIAIYFHKEGIEKKASDDSAFEGNGWCRVWIQDDEISSDRRYPEILKLADETARIIALKDLARDLAHQALRDADHSAAKVGVQAWFESLHPSDHDRIDWVALANPKSEEQEMAEFDKEMGYESAQEPKIEKKAAEPLLGPTGEPLPTTPETPTTFKKHLKAPPATDREKALPATIEQAQLVKDVESSLSSLEAIKSMVEQAKAKLNAEIKAIEEKGGRVQIEGELKEKIEHLSKLVQATQNQMIYAGDTMVRLVQETKDKPFKPDLKWKVEKLTERLSKYEDAAKYLKQAEDGAQHLATSEDIRELYFFPRKTSKLSKKANFLDTLDQVYNSVLEALKLIIGSQEQPEPAAV